MPKGLLPFCITLLSITVIICGLVYVGLHGNPFKKHAAVKDIKQYIVTHEHISESELLNITPTYAFLTADSLYGADVVFADEPKTTYDYGINLEGQIIQKDHRGKTAKHLENK